MAEASEERFNEYMAMAARVGFTAEEAFLGGLQRDGFISGWQKARLVTIADNARSRRVAQRHELEAEEED